MVKKGLFVPEHLIRIMYSIRTLLILGLIISSFSVFAQEETSDPAAREILEQVADRFDSME